MSMQPNNSVAPGRRAIVAPTLHNHGPSLLKFLAVCGASVLINGTVLGLMMLISLLLGISINDTRAEETPPVEEKTEVEETPKEFDLTNNDLGLDDSVPLNYNVDRLDEVSVPGKVDPTQNVGIKDAPEAAPMSIPPPPGAGGGTGGAVLDPNVSGTGAMAGTIGGMGGFYNPGGFGGRSGATREKMVSEGGGNARSEKAVADGLRWLALHQCSDGRWTLHEFNRHARTEPLGDPNGVAGRVVPDNSTPETTRRNDVAATAFGLLPFLAAGITHKPGPRKGWLRTDMTVSGQQFTSGTQVQVLSSNIGGFKCRLPVKGGKGTIDAYLTTAQVRPQPDYHKGVGMGLRWLVARQSKSGNDRGYYGGDMYSHGLATIAMCEAYGLTSDPMLKASAQLALNYIMYAQDPAGGGWRYAARQAGDTSVTGWQLMALKSGQMAGLSVRREVLKKVEKYLDSCESGGRSLNDRGGYGYVPGSGPTPAMTAVGGLCRQYLGVNPRNPSLLATVRRIKQVPPGSGNIYYEYYATQVMHHMGGEAWNFWNLGPDGSGKGGIRDILIAKQDDGRTRPSQQGSFSGSDHVGGRLGATSLCLLSLEVYYRHLPLYRRDLGVTKPGDK